MTREELKQTDSECIAHTYRRFDAVLAQGKMPRPWIRAGGF